MTDTQLHEALRCILRDGNLANMACPDEDIQALWRRLREGGFVKLQNNRHRLTDDGLIALRARQSETPDLQENE